MKNISIRVVDFGSVIFDYEYYTIIVVIRYYRSFEVIFGE